MPQEYPTDAWSVMQRFYAAEAEYVAAGGYGKASYDAVAAHLDPEVILHQAPASRSPAPEPGAAATAWNASWPPSARPGNPWNS
ncbi:hypothetical protein [Actinomadura barringtoniae]|uniref:hypothetical protein n=1 Tax=Actinomadura barringtoniae TaxID=1427535 RepID=UPI001FB6D0FC|nr:hypothetical protein [Actinomadura barringtoniae]